VCKIVWNEGSDTRSRINYLTTHRAGEREKKVEEWKNEKTKKKRGERETILVSPRHLSASNFLINNIAEMSALENQNGRHFNPFPRYVSHVRGLVGLNLLQCMRVIVPDVNLIIATPQWRKEGT